MSKANPMMPTEAQEQSAFFDWVRIGGGNLPGIKLIHAIPNGGSRDVREAVHLKRQGVLEGVADIFWPCACGPYHGLYIEMKRRDGGRRSKAQIEFAEAVAAAGYKHVFANGCDAAIGAVLDYWKSSCSHHGTINSKLRATSGAS